MQIHRLMCLELKKFINRISEIFPAIEAARPRCASGIQALCSLNLAMDKAKLFVQHCSESSKLYLVRILLIYNFHITCIVERKISHPCNILTIDM
jgi:hypothetical protein